MAKETGGPAFPQTKQQFQGDHGGGRFVAVSLSDGMTLRDWFAGQALSGWLASYGDQAEHPAANESNEYSERVAKLSYALADAMIAERSKP